MNTAKKFFPLFFLSSLLLCNAAMAGQTPPPFSADSAPPAPEYSAAESWLALPGTDARYAVDVFWVYPTILHNETDWLMDIADKPLREAARQTITRQASVFTGQANLYAPLYRQMNMAGLTLPKTERDALIEYGKQDVWRAFQHYLKHFNNGRPFLLAAHSQGSNILTDLAARYWGTTGAETRLVAAYLIGWSITREDLDRNSAMVMCENPSQTQCFISYNTVAKGKQAQAPTIRPGAIAVNPLTWKTDGAMAPARHNLGAAFFNDDGTRTTYPAFTSAQVENCGLVVVPSDPARVSAEATSFPEGVFHQFDYSLFYENLKANAALRIQTYLWRRH